MVGLARDRGMRTVFVPAVDAAEAALIADVDVIRSARWRAASHLRGDVGSSPSHVARGWTPAAEAKTLVDLAHVKGQEHAKQALEAAIRGRNLLRYGTGRPLLVQLPLCR